MNCVHLAPSASCKRSRSAESSLVTIAIAVERVLAATTRLIAATSAGESWRLAGTIGRGDSATFGPAMKQHLGVIG